jgi:hypothetical protein
MKLGLLADTHEHTRRLQKAIAVLEQHGAERFVVLGDVLDTGKRIERTVRLLQQVRAVGVCPPPPGRWRRVPCCAAADASAPSSPPTSSSQCRRRWRSSL